MNCQGKQAEVKGWPDQSSPAKFQDQTDPMGFYTFTHTWCFRVTVPAQIGFDLYWCPRSPWPWQNADPFCWALCSRIETKLFRLKKKGFSNETRSSQTAPSSTSGINCNTNPTQLTRTGVVTEFTRSSIQVHAQSRAFGPLQFLSFLGDIF